LQRRSRRFSSDILSTDIVHHAVSAAASAERSEWLAAAERAPTVDGIRLRGHGAESEIFCPA